MGGAWGFFGYDAMDYKAAQDYLDRRAADGWVLRKVWLGFLAQFEPGEGRSHFVDLDIRPAIEDSDPDYLQLCSDAGWEQVQRDRGMILFRSQPGAHPVPIQTDPGMEQERFWKKYMLKQLLVAVIALLVSGAVLLLLPSSGMAWSNILISNAGLLYFLFLALIALYALWSGFACLAYFFQCRNMGGMAIPGRHAARARAGMDLTLSILLICVGILSLGERTGLVGQTVDLAWYPYSEEYTATVELCQEYPILTGTDLSLTVSDTHGRFLNGHRSVLAEGLDYSEVTGNCILTTQRYRCVTPFLARWTLASLRHNTANGGFHPRLAWVEAPGLGFDESWSAKDGSYLLLRQGNVTVLVGATDLDLTSPHYLALVRSRLGLEGA